MRIYSGLLKADVRMQFIQDGVAHAVVEFEGKSYGLELEDRYLGDLENIVSDLLDRHMNGEQTDELELLG